MRFVPIRAIAVLCFATASAAAGAASIFLTGHDPDFHATLGGNTTGAQDLITTGVDFVTDPTFNVFAAGGVSRFLFVESNIPVPGGHTVGRNGVIAAGFAQGTDFVAADASTLNAQLDLLGTDYDAIVVASDFGGILTSAELDILNARSADIISFLNAGGGIFAMAESDGGAHLTTGSDLFGYLPFVVSSSQLDQSEIGNTVTAFGSSLGLTNNDVNGNASHNIFNSAGTLNVVDRDAAGHILTIAGHVDRVPNPTPEPATLLLLGIGLAAAAGLRRQR